MTTRNLLGSAVFASASIAAALIDVAPAYAEQAGPNAAVARPTPPCVDADGKPCQVIYVTGSRIRRPNVDSPEPVTAVQGAEFFQNGTVSVGDTLNNLPQLSSTFGQSNSTRFLGTTGLNLLDLRGLGPQRTLVLVNGRRHVGGDVTVSGTSLDVTTIPADLIDRVEVVTGGNSSVYGSDAIAGVVNFVLKKQFDGFQVRGQAGASTYGDADTRYVSALWGKNFGGGRGNVAIDAEYSRRAQYFASARPWLAKVDAFIPVESDPPGSPDGSDGIPDRIFYHDVRNPSFSNTGVVRFNTGQCGADLVGVPYLCTFSFQKDGTLIPLVGTHVGLGPGGAFVGGNGESFRSGKALQLAPSLRAFDATLLAHYEVSPAFEPFVEATFIRTNSSGTGSNGPTAITGFSTGDPRERPMLSNPYLSSQARQLIIDELTLQNGAPPGPDTRFPVRENFVGMPPFSDNPTRNTLRLVGGVRGNLGSDWSYEVSVDYDRLYERNRVTGNPDIQRFLLAADAAVNPATGQIQCRSQFDPSARIGFVDQGATLNSDIAACIPLNLFATTFSKQQLDYLMLDTTITGRTSQFDASGFVTGNLNFLTLPGGPVSVVAGLEYRSNGLYYHQDPRITAGYTFYNVIPTLAPPTSTVKEGFAEVRAPIFSDRPLLQLVEIDGAARASNYNLGKTGTVLAYNAAAQWAPVRDFRFRGAYARAVRAPNQSELSTPSGENFALGFEDPCSASFIGGGSSTRAANCAAAGRPTAMFGTPPYGPNGYDFHYSDPLEFFTSGNPNLKAETSNSVTVGGVLTPRLVPGLSISADYYSIIVKNAISSADAQSIVNACYDAPSLANQFCALFQRNQVPDTIIPNPANPNNPQIIGNGPHGEFQFQILQGSLLQQPLNYAKLTARGIDIEVAYHGQVGKLGRVESRLNYTHVFERSQNLDPTNPAFKDVLLMELGNPQDEILWNSSITHGRLTLGYQLHYISKMVLDQFEDWFSVQGRPPENADFADHRFYPAVFYHDVRAGFDVTPRHSLYFGVDNLTNTKPPLGLTGIGEGDAIYDNRGRFFYAGVVARY